MERAVWSVLVAVASVALLAFAVLVWPPAGLAAPVLMVASWLLLRSATGEEES